MEYFKYIFVIYRYFFFNYNITFFIKHSEKLNYKITLCYYNWKFTTLIQQCNKSMIYILCKKTWYKMNGTFTIILLIYYYITSKINHLIYINKTMNVYSILFSCVYYIIYIWYHKSNYITLWQVAIANQIYIERLFLMSYTVLM